MKQFISYMGAEMNQSKIFPKRALISVSNKTGLLKFVTFLVKAGVEIISTGGTANYLSENGIKVIKVSEITNFPEIMGGRIKTLHPLLLGGILGRRNQDQIEASDHNIQWIDLVVCNLYPFAQAIEADNSNLANAIENIDIGGPTMLRAAAKNHEWLTVVIDPADYDQIESEISDEGISYLSRRKLAKKTFAHTASYDAMIASYLTADDFPNQVTLDFEKYSTPRYGENPHQAASIYKNNNNVQSIVNTTQIQGKEMSYNNYVDGQAALDVVIEHKQPSAVVIKHAMPCGMAQASSIEQAFKKAFNADSKSAFGGIIGLNQKCTAEIAKDLSGVFMEVIIAPDYSAEALEILSEKNNLRVLKYSKGLKKTKKVHRFLPGGLLIQDNDDFELTAKSLQHVCGEQLMQMEMDDGILAWYCVKHLKSNAIAIVKNGQSVGLGAGQVSRVDAVRIALEKAGTNANGAVLASDAFFPFRDSIDIIARSGIKAIIQPGGSKRDDEVIAACKEHGISLFHTGIRAFNH